MHLVYISEVAVRFIVESLFVYTTGVAAMSLKATAPCTRRDVVKGLVRLTPGRLGDVGCSELICCIVSTASVTNIVIYCERIMHGTGLALSHNIYKMGFTRTCWLPTFLTRDMDMAFNELYVTHPCLFVSS